MHGTKWRKPKVCGNVNVSLPYSDVGVFRVGTQPSITTPGLLYKTPNCSVDDSEELCVISFSTVLLVSWASTALCIGTVLE